MAANYSNQSKLVLQLTEKLGAANEKIQLLEEASRVSRAQKEQDEKLHKKAISELERERAGRAE